MHRKNITSLVGGLAMATLLLVLLPACTSSPQLKNLESEAQALQVAIPESRPWSERMALSIIQRAPIAWKNDFQDRPRWNYTLGLVLQSVAEVGQQHGDPAFLAYARSYGDTMIYNNGEIRDYDLTKFNIDYIAPGPLLMHLYEETSEEKYLTAMNTLMRQLEWQPRTTEGGYWHKLQYPWQIWLDGLFMGEPFQAEYASRFDRPEAFDHIAAQFILAEEKMRDPATGLLYHGWDESRLQRWADPQTGLSDHFWGRAIGWYCMGLVDVLDFFPKHHPKRKELLSILNRTLEAVVAVRDPKTKTWWQVLDLPKREGNYLESTTSCMFTYTMIKGVNEGYLPVEYRKLALESYEGILATFIRVDLDGGVNLTDGCSVAGLGGDPYRDGSFEYYISEPVRDNDPKGIGPFMRASLEFEKTGPAARL